jgi:hypothetical protein
MQKERKAIFPCKAFKPERLKALLSEDKRACCLKTTV